MQDLIIDDFEELEYNLSSIGLPDYYFCVEKDKKYIYGKNVYIEINSDTVIKPYNENSFSINNEDCFLLIPTETFEQLKQLF